MKKVMIAKFILSILIICGLSLFGCASDRPQDILTVFGLKQPEITKVVLRDGNTGETVIVDSEDRIGEFLALLEGNSLIKAADQSLRAGYFYAAQIFRGDQQAALILFSGGGDLIKVNNTYYDLSPGFEPDQLERIFRYIHPAIERNLY